MQSFHQSRGRIVFDFFCALVIVASCVGAWRQTGATALLAAAGVVGLYGLVRLFDMRWPATAEAVEPQRVDFAEDPQVDELASLDADLPKVVPELHVVTGDCSDEAELSEPVAPVAKADRKAKAPRKGGGRKASGAKDAKVTELAPLEVAAIADFTVPDETTHAHIEPLFEPEPFARMPRRAFGRRGQI